jgi:hypothetical protein
MTDEWTSERQRARNSLASEVVQKLEELKARDQKLKAAAKARTDRRRQLVLEVGEHLRVLRTAGVVSYCVDAHDGERAEVFLAVPETRRVAVVEAHADGELRVKDCTTNGHFYKSTPYDIAMSVMQAADAALTRALEKEGG